MLRLHRHYKCKHCKDPEYSEDAQAIIEFTFCMVIVFLMFYALVMIFRWSGVDLAERRIAHERILTFNIVDSYSNNADGPLRQIDPYFFNPSPMNAIWRGN